MIVKIQNYSFDTAERLGEGGFGCVYKGKSKNGREVAIKHMRQECFGMMESFVKEVQVLMTIKHDHVVTFLGWDHTDVDMYLVLEYCNGGDLARYLQKTGKLSEDVIKFFLIQMAGGMRVMYNLDIIHRDLKPLNILLTYDTRFPRYPHYSQICLKIADFGISKSVPDGLVARTRCGTPIYMAPEILSRQNYDYKADLWSAGVMIFEFLTGNVFSDKNKYIPTNASEDLVNLILGLLQPKPKDRMDFLSFYSHKFIRN